MITLATQDGRPVACVPAKRRFWSAGGELHDGAQPSATPTRDDARLALRAYERMIAEGGWPEPVVRILQREARELGDAILDLCAQLRASGPNPNTLGVA